MAPPNEPVNPTLSSEPLEQIFHLSDGKFTVKTVPLLSQVPQNVSFTPFSSVESDAPPSILHRVLASSHKGGFFGFSQETPSDRLMNSLGSFSGRDFLSIFRFKTWWSTQWVGNSGSDLQMETQWVLIDVPEIKSYVIIIPIIEGSFRSALFPGSDGNVMIGAESGSTQVKASRFHSIAYVHVSENPYNLMREAYSALRVHLNTFRLLEEKTLPSMVDKFGWCTWDAFYLTVDPVGIWHGLKDFAEAGFAPRFLIVDDGWQSINLDGDDPHEDAKGLILCGGQMSARLHRLDECEKFRNYQPGLMLGPDAPPFNPKPRKDLIAKAFDREHLEIQRDEAIESGSSNVAEIETKLQQVVKEINDILGGIQLLSKRECGTSGRLKAFTKDLRTCFKGLDDIYMWHAVCGAWGGVKPGATHLNSKLAPCIVSPGLDGTMPDLAVVRIVNGSIGLVHPEQANDLYNSMHSYLAESGVTGVKVDVMQVSFLFLITSRESLLVLNIVNMHSILPNMQFM